MARRTKDAPGRVTPKGTKPAGTKGPGSKVGSSRRAAMEDDRPRYAREATGRYTAPTHAEAVAPSPKWVPVIMLAFFAGGLLSIVLNYLSVLPAAPTNWYLLGGLVAIIIGFVISTRWH